MATSSRIKLNKLKCFRPLEVQDSTYINIFQEIGSNSDRILIDNKKVNKNYEDNNFEGFNINHFEECNLEGFSDVDVEECDFEGFPDIESDAIPLDILKIIPAPLEDNHKDKAKEDEDEDVDYFIVEKGSQRGNDLIQDTWGYNYTYFRESKGIKKIKSFRCVKRHVKEKPDCKCIIQIENYGQKDMKIRQSVNMHNHEPDFSVNLRRQVNMDLRRECMDKEHDTPSKVIHNVLLSDKDYLKFHDKVNTLPLITSMKNTIY